jgi:hypothetical protein
MLEKIWNDIQFIYDGFNFSSNLLINDLMIVSQDNCYFIYYKPSEIITQIRIEKNYDLVRMWSDNEEVEILDYKLAVEVDGKIEIDEIYKIELINKIIKPFLREAKLNRII